MSEPLPRDLRDVLPPDTARSWVILREHIPESMVLHGGTALTAYLKHRASRDLDFFFDDPHVDLHALAARLGTLRPFAATLLEKDTLNGFFGDTKVQFLSMAGQEPVDDDIDIAGLRIASLRDLAATKIKVIGDRGELRDYFDLKAIEEQTSLTIESSLLDYQARYQTDDQGTLVHIVRALGYLDDVGDDPALPSDRRAIEDYWHARQPGLLGALDSTGLVRPEHLFVPEHTTPARPARGSGDVWVPGHTRDGRVVRGYWRRR